MRFPTSLEHDGSDAMNTDPDYSAAYAVMTTDTPDLAGHALCFTIGRGNDVVVAAIEALRPHVVGRLVAEVTHDLGGFSAGLISDSQLRWLGPEKGVMHMAIGAVVNAAWDLAARRAGMPVWRLLADMSPEEIVDLVDFRYLDRCAHPARTRWRSSRAARPGRRRPDRRTAARRLSGVHDNAGLARLRRRQARPARQGRRWRTGFTQIKLKVGANAGDDARRHGVGSFRGRTGYRGLPWTRTSGGVCRRRSRR